jgi:hypothetical protein
MHQTVLTSGRDAYLIGIPLILLMLIGLFRLDEAFLRPKKGPRRPPPPSGVDEKGRQIYSDPDGKTHRFN